MLEVLDFFSSPGQNPSEFLLSLGVYSMSSLTFAYFNLHVQNFSTKWNQTCQGWSLGEKEIQICTNEVDPL